MTVQAQLPPDRTQQLSGCHCNTHHLLGTYSAYQAVLSATDVTLIPKTNLLGEYHYCSHFPDKATGSDRVYDLSKTKQAEGGGVGIRTLARVTPEPCATWDSAMALILTIHLINRPRLDCFQKRIVHMI